jgi:excinuclease ABC subunit A
MIANADHIIDMGPGGGTNGGRVIATGTPDQLRSTRESFTGRHLDAHLRTGSG